MMMPGETTPNLRERNRARARAEIAAAALALFAEKGFEAVTVDHIVAAAGVSRRTFFRYFETKEDALLADYPELTDRLASALAGAAGEEPTEAIRHALHHMVDWYEERGPAVLERSKVIRGSVNPSARNLGFLTQWEKSIAATLVTPGGPEPGSLVARTGAAVVVAAFRAALTQWVRSECREDLRSLTDRSLDLVLGGLEAALPGGGGRQAATGRPA